MQNDSLLKPLKTLIAIRVFFVTFLLGSFFVLQIGYGVFPFPSIVLHLIVILYALSIIYVLLLGRVSGQVMAYVQICLDATAIIGLIFLTGGIESWFSFLMILVVIAAGVVLGRSAGYFTAIYTSILYGVMVDMQFYGMLPIASNPLLTERDFLFNIFSHFLALYLTAYLVGYLASSLEERGIYIEDLTRFNKEVIESTPSGLFTTDLSGRVQIFNKAAEKITGTLRASANGQDISQVFPFLSPLAPLKRNEETITVQGRERVVGMTVSPMLDAKGKETGFIGIFQDLTELKRMSEDMKSREKWATIGELSANMAHEIKNPLASLRGSIEMLREDTTMPAQKERLMSIALSEMDRLDRVVSDFLQYSKPSYIEPGDMNLQDVLEKTLDLVSGMELGETTIIRRYPESMPIHADSRKLEQVFLNLALNALDAMPEGGVLTVEAGTVNGSMDITFSDTGAGIKREEREKVFYPFFTTKSTGTGLGLSIVHRIVEDHGGTIGIATAQGGGAAFNITLPLSRKEQSENSQGA